MNLRVDIGWLIASLLLATRVAGATLLAPVLGPTQIPGSVRVILSLALGTLLLAGIATPTALSAAQVVDSAPALAAAMLSELVIGASLAVGFLVAYAATQVAGRTLDIQMGFGAAAVFNPFTQGFSPLLGSLFGMVAIAVFLSLDGHHLLVRALAATVVSFPPGALLQTLDWEAFFRQSGVMFAFGLTLAAPVMFALLLADIALGVLARSMPQLNVFVLSFAVKIVLGVIGLAAAIPLAEQVLQQLFGTAFEYWDQVSGASAT